MKALERGNCLNRHLLGIPDVCSFTGDFERQEHLGSCFLDPVDVKSV